MTAPPSGECYRDSDCQFFQKDSSGLISGEIVGTCVKRSESLSMCKCIEGYTGKNCEFKLCPISLNTDLMCNGVQGEGDDYYGPLKGSYMGSEWNTYDQVDPVEFVPTQQSAAVGGLCDFTTGRCSCVASACSLQQVRVLWQVPRRLERAGL